MSHATLEPRPTSLAPADLEYEPRRRPRNPVTIAVMSLLIVLGTAIPAYFVGAQGKKVYGAEAEILYPVPDLGSVGAAMDTQRVILESRAVLAPVAARFSTTSDDLNGALSVYSQGASQVLNLQVRNGDPELARRLTEAISNSYIRTVVEIEGRSRPRPRIITPPHVLGAPLEPRPKRAAAAGVLVGLLVAAGAVGIVVALSRERAS